jgi:hypothetical protein
MIQAKLDAELRNDFLLTAYTTLRTPAKNNMTASLTNHNKPKACNARMGSESETMGNLGMSRHLKCCEQGAP